MDKMLSELVEILHKENCSCVIRKEDRITVCRERGVKDLYRIYMTAPEILDGASIADKVVGKGAAALMALGRVKEVYADVISVPALQLLEAAGVPVSYGVRVANIINRAGTGICPVESLCMDAATPEECLPLIAGFIQRISGAAQAASDGQSRIS